MPTMTADNAFSGRPIGSGAPRLFDDLSVSHAEDPVGPRAHDRIVRDEDEGLPLLAIQPAQEVPDQARRFRVEVAGRFIGPYDRGIVHQGAGDRDPLLLSRAELCGLVSGPTVE